jgi:hypothetical protein
MGAPMAGRAIALFTKSQPPLRKAALTNHILLICFNRPGVIHV